MAIQCIIVSVTEVVRLRIGMNGNRKTALREPVGNKPAYREDSETEPGKLCRSHETRICLTNQKAHFSIVEQPAGSCRPNISEIF